jgi:protocatechuate 3,4-dioxygenase beta subunit
MLNATPTQPNRLTDLESPRVITLSRRDALKFGAAGAATLAGLGLAARTARADTATGTATEGPFWVDERLLRQDVRSEPTTGVLQPGLPLRMEISVSRLNTVGTPSPLVGAWVDIWHAGGAGSYSDANGSGNPNTIGQKWLRGYQITDSHGMVRFITIYPGWYIGRAVHIHARVRVFSGATATTNFTTQFFFNEATSTALFTRLPAIYGHSGTRTLNSTDMIYSSLGSQAILRMADDGSHAVASFNIKLSPTTGGLTRGFGRDWTELACENEHAFDFGGGTPSTEMRKVMQC